ncbi:MAG: CTP synthase [Candidatus Izemoplasmataceae bacterium]
MKEIKYIFVTGGVVSSLGKGITASSLGRLLKNRGFKVFMQKFDPYLNVDPGTMSPYQHGEVFVTEDGAETDLDLGHYERFIDENLNCFANVTTGQIYKEVIEKERRGDYLGATIQVIPHVTDLIKEKIILGSKTSDADIVITEIGGTVGDIESLPFIEAIRQMRRDLGVKNTLFIHNTLVPYLEAAEEMKTKPTQHSVKELREQGIAPDLIVLRTTRPITEDMREKVALFCDVDSKEVIEARDQDIIYEVVNALKDQGMDWLVLDHFALAAPKPDMGEWNELIRKVRSLKHTVDIGLIGKYVALKDAYISVLEAVKHAGYALDCKVNVHPINSETLEDDGDIDRIGSLDGIIVPGGFGKRGTEGKMNAIRIAREKRIPFLGLCYGMQLATIEFARNVCGLDAASSTEIDPDTPVPLFALLKDQKEDMDLGGTLRLGAYPCHLKEGSLAASLYKKDDVLERHRHRYEFNNEYMETLKDKGMVFSGIYPAQGLVEIVELGDHPYFIGSQFHPEFKSRPERPHPLFKGLIQAAFERKRQSSL